jgi:hypothetical protein
VSASVDIGHGFDSVVSKNYSNASKNGMLTFQCCRWLVTPSVLVVSVAPGTTSRQHVVLQPPVQSAPLAMVERPRIQLSLRRYANPPVDNVKFAHNKQHNTIVRRRKARQCAAISHRLRCVCVVRRRRASSSSRLSCV